MFEPTFLPQLKEKTINFSKIRFGLVYSDKFVAPQSPDIEPAHIHEYPEIFFNVSSNVSFLVNNRLYWIPHGSAIISRQNEVHVCIYNEAQKHEYFCLWLDAEKDTLDILLPLFKENVDPLYSFDEAKQIRLLKLLQNLYSLCQKTGNELKKASFLLEILTLFEEASQTKPIDAAIPISLQKIIDDIHLNFTQINSVNDIIERHFISSATLNRWFKKYIHISPHKFLESKKLANAAKLLSCGATVTEACIQSGFSDCSHFIVLFKKKFGETPLKYKKDFY